jgi:hypothetical protein
MPSKASSHVLTDHDEIRQWAEERGARPAAVRRTESDSDVGIIRLDFPGYAGEESLDEIDWDEWFQKFDENGLALVVQDRMVGGQRSNFNKLVSRDTVESSRQNSRSRKRTSRTAARSRTASASSRKSRSKSSARSSSRSARGTTARTAPKKRSSSHRGGRSRRAA